MLRKILVPLDTSKYTPVATRVAADIANNVRAVLGRDAVTLQGLGVVDLDLLPKGRFAALMPKEEILHEARATVAGLIAAFREQVARLEIPEAFIETRTTEGSPFAKIIHHHVFCDLVVMGTRCAFPPANDDYETLVHLLFESSRPLLIVSDKPRPFRTVVMAMDGTAASSRLLYAYAQINPFPDAKVVIVHSSYEERYHDLKDFFGRVSDYLTAYKFDVEQLRLDGHLMEGLPQVVQECGADAVAMGIHSESALHRLGTPLHLLTLPLERLLDEAHVALFTVG